MKAISHVIQSSHLPIAPNTSMNQKRLFKRLRREILTAHMDFKMIEENDLVMVCLSGGKDSYTLLDILQSIQTYGELSFKLIAVHLDQKQPYANPSALVAYAQSLKVPMHVIEQDTYSVVKRNIPEGKTQCSLCSRLRQGALYQFAAQQGVNKIALGHHKWDILETFFLNLFFGGKLKAMPPKLRSDDGKHVVIRPLAYCDEKDIRRYSQGKRHPIMPCGLCGQQPNLQRQTIKEMIQTWEEKYPDRSSIMLRGLAHVTPSHLMDQEYFNFKSI